MSNSLPSIVIVGSASRAVDEAKERIRGAFTSAGLNLPRKRITVNLAPADVPKNDSSLDLAIAVAILHVSKQIPSNRLRKTVVIGELGLAGDVRSSRGIIGKILSARRLGYKDFVIPARNISQAQLIPGVRLVPVEDLRQLYVYLSTGTSIAPIDTKQGLSDVDMPATDTDDRPQLSQVVGQDGAKRALEIVAAGGHNLLLSGPPGTGKSMLAKSLPSLLPPLTREEILEVTHLHSLANSNYEALVVQRPFRAPHHSASPVSIMGARINPQNANLK